MKPAESEETENVAGPSRLSAEKRQSADEDPASETQDAPGAAEDDGDDVNEPEYDPDEDTGLDYPEFPISHQLVMKDHTKVVSALALDPSGARVVSGSHDYAA